MFRLVITIWIQWNQMKKNIVGSITCKSFQPWKLQSAYEGVIDDPLMRCWHAHKFNLLTYQHEPKGLM